jgi:hypothetical protein
VTGHEAFDKKDHAKLDHKGLPGIENLPSNIIALWSSSIRSIPNGWKICDGTSGTPELKPLQQGKKEILYYIMKK